MGIHLPVQETQVRSLGQEDATCCGATKPECHKLKRLLCNKRSHCNQKPPHDNRDPAQPQINNKFQKMGEMGYKG